MKLALVVVLLAVHGFTQSSTKIGATEHPKAEAKSSSTPVTIITVTARLDGALNWEPVAMNGMVFGGHCSLTPRNEATAKNLANIWLGGYGDDSTQVPNWITINHPAVAGLAVDIVCFAARGDK